jgi:hypothetical protein
MVIEAMKMKTHPFFNKLCLLAARNRGQIIDECVIVRTAEAVYVRNQTGTEIFRMYESTTGGWELKSIDGNGKDTHGPTMYARRQRALFDSLKEFK